MSKKKSYRAETMVVDEAIPVEESTISEEAKAAAKDLFEEPAVITSTITEEEVKKLIYTVKQAGEVIPWTLNVREYPSMDAAILKVIRQKDDVEILDENTENGWLPILLADGTKGYCMSKFIKEIK